MFLVPGVIGKADPKSSASGAKYLNYAEFVQGINSRVRSLQTDMHHKAEDLKKH